VEALTAARSSKFIPVDKEDVSDNGGIMGGLPAFVELIFDYQY
jgi:hypothetical protein